MDHTEMANHLNKILLISFILLQMIGVSWSYVTLSFEFMTFHNPRGLLLNGNRCDPTSACDHEFVFCFDDINGDVINMDQCSYGRERSGIFGNKNNITFGDVLHQNPVSNELPDSAEGLLLKVQVLDRDNITHSALVDMFYHKFNIGMNISGTKTSAIPIPTIINGNNDNRLLVEFSYYCSPSYYLLMGKCQKYCQGRDDQYGHYTCDEKGEIVCLTGWTDIHTHCTKEDESCKNIQCLNGGTCLGMEGCRCAVGFEGSDCSNDVNECVAGTGTFGICAEENTTRCQNIAGGFICHCKVGFYGNRCQFGPTNVETTPQAPTTRSAAQTTKNAAQTTVSAAPTTGSAAQTTGSTAPTTAPSVVTGTTRTVGTTPSTVSTKKGTTGTTMKAPQVPDGNEITPEVPKGVIAQDPLQKNRILFAGLGAGLVILTLIIILVLVVVLRKARRKREDNARNTGTSRPQRQTGVTDSESEPYSELSEMDRQSSIKFGRPPDKISSSKYQSRLGPRSKAAESGTRPPSSLHSRGIDPNHEGVEDNRPLGTTDSQYSGSNGVSRKYEVINGDSVVYYKK